MLRVPTQTRTITNLRFKEWQHLRGHGTLNPEDILPRQIIILALWHFLHYASI